MISCKKIGNRLKICLENIPQIIRTRVEILNFKGRCKDYSNEIILTQDLINLIFTSKLRNIATIFCRKVIDTIQDIEECLNTCTEESNINIEYMSNRKRTILDYFQDFQS